MRSIPNIMRAFATAVAFSAAWLSANTANAMDPQQAAACGYELEDIIHYKISTLLGVQVWKKPTIRASVVLRSGQAPTEVERIPDLIFVDPGNNRTTFFETTVRSLNKADKVRQRLIDASIVKNGAQFVGNPPQPIAPESVNIVYVIPYTPGNITQRRMTEAKLMFYNYEAGETNWNDLPETFRPSLQVMYSVLRPAQLSAYMRQLVLLQEQDPELIGALNGLLTSFQIVADIADASWHAYIADERRAGIAAAFVQLRGEYPKGQTFWAEVTEGSDMAGPYAESYGATGCLPTLTYARVVEIGAANPACRPGTIVDVSRPSMTAYPMRERFQMYQVCLSGTAEIPTGASGGGYVECEVLQDPMCPR